MADNKQFSDYLAQLQKAQFPRWADLPQFDLYMDQVIQYVNDIVTPLGFGEITSTMVNNYVKKGVIQAPVKKSIAPTISQHTGHCHVKTGFCFGCHCQGDSVC